MATLVIDRQTLPETLSSFFLAPRIAVMPSRERGDIVLSPIVNPEDYECDSDYLHAVPGMVDKILAARNAPLCEDEDVSEDWRHV